ncbi:hypothetical protein Tco_0218402 [Tanacetum coccineum]
MVLEIWCLGSGNGGVLVVAYTSGASDADYLQRALTDYHNSGEVLEYLQEREDKKNKRYKSSDSISFNTKESREGSINLNTTVRDEEDEVEEVRRSRPIGRDQAKRKAKAGSSLAGSKNAFDVESFTKMMANEYVMASDPYNVQKSQQISELLQIKNKELKLKAVELKSDVWRTVKETKHYMSRRPMKT